MSIPRIRARINRSLTRQFACLTTIKTNDRKLKDLIIRKNSIIRFTKNRLKELLNTDILELPKMLETMEWLIEKLEQGLREEVT